MQSEYAFATREDACPVTDRELGELYRASAEGLVKLVESVPPTLRATLAMYCYRRAHLASIGLVIAATCDKDDLALAGGNAGTMLYDRSREPQASSFPDAGSNDRRKITLPSAAFRQPVLVMEEDDLSVPDLTDAEISPAE